MRSLSKQHSHSLLLNMYKLKIRCWHNVAVGVRWRICYVLEPFNIEPRCSLNLTLHHEFLVEAMSPTRRMQLCFFSIFMYFLMYFYSLWTTSMLNDHLVCRSSAPLCVGIATVFSLGSAGPHSSLTKQLLARVYLWKAAAKQPVAHVLTLLTAKLWTLPRRGMRWWEGNTL